jgi:uncharacterized protein YsxB (DUF464 family)
MNRADRTLVEDLFADGHVQVGGTGKCVVCCAIFGVQIQQVARGSVLFAVVFLACKYSNLRVRAVVSAPMRNCLLEANSSWCGAW